MQECLTAEDVRQLARKRALWRQAQFRKPDPVPVVAEKELAPQWPADPFAQRIVKIAEEPEQARPSVRLIKEIVAEHYGVTLLDMDSQRRTASLVRPRQVAMYLAKNLTLHSLPAIGRQMGRRDHTTILYAVRKFDALTKSDAELAALVEQLKAKINERVERLCNDMD